MNSLTLIILQEASKPGGKFFFIYLIAIVFIFYFFFMRPQAKKAKDQQKFRDQLQKGDKIVTNGGIHGRILKIEDDSFLIEVDSNVKLKIEKSAVSSELSNTEPAKK